MEQPEIIQSNDFDFNIWYKTKDPIFSQISKKSRLPEKWISYKFLKNKKYYNSIIKPINRYVEHLYQPPTLVYIENNIVRLRQGNHAEMFLLIKDSGTFYNLDRPWMRQYYNTNLNFEIPKDCFPGTYKFYVPWYIDADIDILYTRPDEDSPFLIYDTQVSHKAIVDIPQYIEPDFVPFHFKNKGAHMIDDGFGKIPRKSAMFDIVFKADDIMIRRVKEFYEQD